MFACDCVREFTGTDLAKDYRGQYKTMLGAMRLMKGSVRSVADRVAKEFVIHEYRDVREAEAGDVVLADMMEMNTLGIISPTRLAVFSTTTGLADYPSSVSKAAWRIG